MSTKMIVADVTRHVPDSIPADAVPVRFARRNAKTAATLRLNSLFRLQRDLAAAKSRALKTGPPIQRPCSRCPK